MFVCFHLHIEVVASLATVVVASILGANFWNTFYPELAALWKDGVDCAALHNSHYS
jgi:hypothetical protein